MKTYRITATHSTAQSVATQYICAQNAGLVVAHCMREWPDAEPGESVFITVEALQVLHLPVKDVPKQPREQPEEKAAPRKTRKTAGTADGEVERDEVLRLTGLTARQVTDLVYGGRLQRGTKRGAVTRSSLDAFLASGGIQRGKNVKPVRKDKPAPLEPAPRPKAVKPAAPAKDAENESFVRVEKLAERMGISEGEVLRVKAIGKIEGGYGWVDEIAWQAQYKLAQR